MGHIMRCRAYAFAFEERGWTCEFAVTAATAEWLKDANTTVVPEGLEGAGAIRDIVRDRKPEIIIVDHYELGVEFEQQIYTDGFPPMVVAMEDLPGRKHDVDLLVDSNPGRIDIDYLGLVPRRRTVLYLRSRYALLRPEFWRTRERGFRGLRKTPRKLLIALGASDPDNFSARVIELAPTFRAAGLTTTLIVGPTNPHRTALTDRCAELGVNVVCNPDNLVAIMGGADIAISSASTTCYEFACLGVPTVALIIVDNQRDVGRAIDDIGSALVIDCQSSFEPSRLIDAVNLLASDTVFRERVSAAAQAMIAGVGARRLLYDTLFELANVKRKKWVRPRDF
jgi:UDP-2,4-diacetamido-2,4,6-trideoxy-beta-L-altropyranose hydrolase